MAGMVRWGFAVVVLSVAGHAAADDTPTYKCVARGQVVYSEKPCAGGKQVGAPKPRVNVRYEAPPQDRAKAARRAALSEGARAECTSLEGRLREQEGELRAKGEGATLQDEMPLVHSKRRFRELGC